LRGGCRSTPPSFFTGWLSLEEYRTHLTAARAVGVAVTRAADGDRDGIANILLEAMALGTPVSRQRPALPGEVLVDRRNGPTGAAR
jgi:glycosyltransferase involved in cell wall biosynthesis